MQSADKIIKVLEILPVLKNPNINIVNIYYYLFLIWSNGQIMHREMGKCFLPEPWAKYN